MNAINNMYVKSLPSKVVCLLNFDMDVNYVDISYKLREINDHYKHAKKVHVYIDLKVYESGLFHYGGYSEQVTKFIDIAFKQLNEFREYSGKKVYVHYFKQTGWYDFDKYYQIDIGNSSKTYDIPIINNMIDTYTIGKSKESCVHLTISFALVEIEENGCIVFGISIRFSYAEYGDDRTKRPTFALRYKYCGGVLEDYI